MAKTLPRYSILIIEDEAAIADTIEYALNTDGFECHVRTTGDEGLKAIGQNSVHLVILDVGLPDCNGFDLFRRIRAESDIPVMFLTARGEEVDRVVGLEIGADDYVTKPFSPRELSARVKAILRRSGSLPYTAGRQATSSPFEIDQERFTIRYTGKTLPLSRYEFKILENFIHHPGMVFTRAELMRRVWEEADLSQDRTVDAHIKSLRAKLRAVRPDTDPIVTHRGFGYSLREDW